MKIQNNPYLTYIDIIHILQNSNMVKQSSFFSSPVLKGGGEGASQKLLANLSSTSRRDLSHSIKVAQL